MMEIDENMKTGKYILALLITVGILFPWSQNIQAAEKYQSVDQPVVRVIMFWLNTCGHCEYVINEVLPPLEDQYGEQLEILLVELVAQEDVDRLYETAAILGIPANNVGVPFMLVGEEVLTGSDEIPDRLPGLIETHLASGGLDYPRYAPLEGYLPEAQESQPATIGASDDLQSNPPASETNSTFSEAEEGKEQVSNGFTIALVVLVGMVLALIYVVYALLKDREPGTSQRSAWLDWLVLVVALAGIGVAAYLTYVESTAAEAICGPVGDCNAVQNSSYSRIFGILPVGILGLIGYVAIIIAWAIQKVRQDIWASYAQLAMLAMAFFGTLYSIYLTYLELWVINAVCMWCVSSAVIITLLMLLSVQPAGEALDSLGEVE